MKQATRRGILMAAAVVVGIASSACGRKQPVPAPRYAVLRFENLTGDASLDWAGRAAAAIIERRIGGVTLAGDDSGNITGRSTLVTNETLRRTNIGLGSRPTGVPGLSAEPTAAEASGANRSITGYVEKRGSAISITAVEENLLTQKTIRTNTASGRSVFEALQEIGRVIAPGQPAVLTSDAEALRTYSIGIDLQAGPAIAMLRQAVSSDPSFGRAWLALAQAEAAAGDRNSAALTIQEAGKHALSPVDSAWLEIEQASITGDRNTALAALRKVHAVSAWDTDAGRVLAAAESAAGNFAGSAAVWKQLVDAVPDDAASWNQLGYARAWNGDYTGAVSAIREYQRIRPGDPNSLDSLGDIHYWFGKFNEAASAYAAAHSKSATFLNGGELYKAAWARFRSGDKNGADADFAKFMEARGKADAATVTVFQGDWLYRTGHEKEAASLLRGEFRRTPPGTLRSAIATQLAVWDLLAHDRTAAQRDVEASGPQMSGPADLLVRFAAAPSGPASEWETRATRVFAPPPIARLRIPAIAYALLLDGKKSESLPFWKRVVELTPDDLVSRYILARLEGKSDHAPAPDPLKFSPLLSAVDRL